MGVADPHDATSLFVLIPGCWTHYAALLPIRRYSQCSFQDAGSTQRPQPPIFYSEFLPAKNPTILSKILLGLRLLNIGFLYELQGIPMHDINVGTLSPAFMTCHHDIADNWWSDEDPDHLRNKGPPRYSGRLLLCSKVFACTVYS